MKEPLWTPSPLRLSQATLSQFSQWLEARTAASCADYADLHRYSVAAPAEFWSNLWDFSQVVGEKGDPPYLVDAGQMPGARFFPKAQLNFAENLLAARGADPAIVFWGEDKVKRRLSRDELSAEVARTQAALRQAGVTIRDRVAAIL
ncbi:MAG TPA: acetyl-coenzyme A synthetase N-terminal domain-containing protein, partial [Hyphomicrobiaceae bacterium]|nr:acetyl-coenzyme A synthetase N-terminal domain-containing protein [Hyphomicrobiaceae bacterium]